MQTKVPTLNHTSLNVIQLCCDKHQECHLHNLVFFLDTLTFKIKKEVLKKLLLIKYLGTFRE